MDLKEEDLMMGRLASLRIDSPPTLIDRVVARWVRVEGPAFPLYVAFTDLGVSYVRSAEGIEDSADQFLESYRRRFGLPVQPAGRSPSGLAQALHTGRPSGLAFDLDGISEFGRDVLEATAAIPRGETRPYAWIAREIGRPDAVRAVGTALGRNPVPVLIPCHRVTRRDGSVGGYAFGPAAKERLLRVEGTNLDEVREFARESIFYLGSTSSGIFCFPTCHHARRITPKRRTGFRSTDDARRSGYRPCLVCRPAAL